MNQDHKIDRPLEKPYRHTADDMPHEDPDATDVASEDQSVRHQAAARPDADADPEKATPPAPAAPARESPNGGMTAWLVVLGTWCTSFCSFGWLNSIGIFQEYYQTELLSDHSASTIAWIPSLQIFLLMAMGLIIGPIYDRRGPRMLILVGSFLHVFGLMMASLSTQYYQILLSQGVCSAIGAASVFQPSINSLHGWFTTRRGAAFGIMASGSSVGGVVFPIMLTRLVGQVGFPWAMRISAFLILFLLVIANLTIRPFHPPRPRSMTAADFVAPFARLDFVLLAVGFAIFYFGLFIPIDYISVQASASGIDRELAQYLIPILNAASLVGRLGSGLVADRLGNYNVFIAACYLTGVWILALWLPATSEAGQVAFSVVFGLSSGAYISLIAPLVASVSPLPEIGFRTGLVFFLASIGGLVTNPIAGAILEGSGGWTGIKVFSGVFCLAGTTAVLAARISQVGWKFKRY